MSSMSMSLSQKLSTKVSLEQRQKVQLRLLLRQESLMGKLHGETYHPIAPCRCGYSLNRLEILKGFSSNPNDFNTTCPKCSTRFLTELTSKSGVKHAFYCAVQTLDQLKDKEKISQISFKANYSAIFWSAVYHFGSLKQAFGKVGITYQFPEILNWQKKIKQFLGKLPDTVIARYVGKCAKTIRALRHDLHIPRYVKSYEFY